MKNSINISLYLIIPVCLLFACTEENVNPESLELAVLEGYLYANAPVTQINVSRMIPFGSDSQVNYAINDLAVTLEHQSQSYLLRPSEGDSGNYHYEGEDLAIQEGQTYRIQFEFNGEAVSAETTVPPPPSGIQLSNSDVYVQQINFSGGGRPSFEIPDPVEITWDNPDQSYFYILIENIEDNPEDVIVGELPFGRPNFNFVTEPTDGNLYLLQPRTLEQFGTHRIVLFKVNEEYANLYENSNQDSRNLNEPLTNIENGLGVFTAFNSDTLFLELRKL